MSISRTFLWTPEPGGNLFAIHLPFDPREVFGKARAPVIVSIGGHRYRSTVAHMGGPPFVPLRKSNRAAAGIVDDCAAIEVTLTLDEAERTVEVPDDLTAALAQADARAGWDRLSFTTKREHVEAIEGAAKAETREKRLAKAVEAAKAKSA
jgi:hypothetical protein